MPTGKMSNTARTVRDDAAIISAAKLLRDIADTLDDYAQGNESLNRVCQRHGMDTYNIRTLITLKTFANCSLEATPVPLTEAALPLKDGYEKIYDDVFDDMPLDPIVELPIDYIDSVKNALDFLTDREKRIIQMYYGLEDGAEMTLTEIGRAENVTQERVRQIYLRGIRKLKHPSRSKMLRVGITQYEADQRAKAAEYEAYEKMLQAKTDAYVEKVNKALEESIQNVTDDDIAAVDGFYNANIDTLDLSVRSYNCLKRAGIETVGQLIGRSQEDLMKIRNLGRNSLEEVNKKIEFCKTKLACEKLAMKEGA